MTNIYKKWSREDGLVTALVCHVVTVGVMKQSWCVLICRVETDRAMVLGLLEYSFFRVKYHILQQYVPPNCQHCTITPLCTSHAKHSVDQLCGSSLQNLTPRYMLYFCDLFPWNLENHSVIQRSCSFVHILSWNYFVYLMAFGVQSLYQMSWDKFNFWPFVSPLQVTNSAAQIRACIHENGSLYKYKRLWHKLDMLVLLRSWLLY